MLAMANKLDNMKQIAENKLKFKLSLLFPLQRLYTLEGPYFWLYWVIPENIHTLPRVAWVF